MKTFIPYRCKSNPIKGLLKSLKCLDNKRLGKQRVETYQIWSILSGNNTRQGWKNHPAVLMWKGYEDALVLYLILSCKIWATRKTKLGKPFSNLTMDQHIKTFNLNKVLIKNEIKFPKWWFSKELHNRDKAMLYHKNTEYYYKFKKYGDKYNEYLWPSKDSKLSIENNIIVKNNYFSVIKSL